MINFHAVDFSDRRVALKMISFCWRSVNYNFLFLHDGLEKTFQKIKTFKAQMEIYRVAQKECNTQDQ